MFTGESELSSTIYRKYKKLLNKKFKIINDNHVITILTDREQGKHASLKKAKFNSFNFKNYKSTGTCGVTLASCSRKNIVEQLILVK
jgi:hypothetical protein